MTDIRPGTNTQDPFFNPKNEAMLDRLLNADFQRRTGGDLTEKQQQRLVKTVKHYMTEVYAKNPTQTPQYLNKEVLQAVVPDFMSYLKRTGPGEQDSLQMDVSTRFGKLQTERQGAAVATPVAPDFRMNMDSDEPSPISRFEELRRIREEEAARDAEAIASRTEIVDTQQLVVHKPNTQFVDSDISFKSGLTAAQQRDQLSLIMRETERTAGRTEIGTRVPPDPRMILLGEGGKMPPTSRSMGIASGNPTLAIADSYRDRVLPQDVIKPQDDIVAYKEVEHNLFVYSADRDWANNTTENRYNFSVNFDPANNQSGFGYNTATNVKFKNITRIEFVKAIMPTESFDVLATSSSTAGTPLNTLNTNIFSFPYLQVRIPELNVNGYGTNDGINNAFAAISYDAYWTSDSNAANRGYARMIPKFLKCQKTYYPTPLSTLQKLTFQIQRPDGTLVSSETDTLTINAVFMPNDTVTTTNYRATGAATWEWIWLQTSTYFNQFTLSQGDRIVLKNVGFNATLATYPGFTDLVNYLTQPQGLLVSSIGISTGSYTGYKDGGNTAGYANSIVVRNSFQDPTKGFTTVSPWVINYIASLATFTNYTSSSTTITPVVGGSVTLTLAPAYPYAAGIPVLVFIALSPDNNFTATILSYNSTTGVTVLNNIRNVNGTFGGPQDYVSFAGNIMNSGRLINMNHQIQIIMRVITREMDSAAKLRPDNLQA